MSSVWSKARLEWFKGTEIWDYGYISSVRRFWAPNILCNLFTEEASWHLILNTVKCAEGCYLNYWDFSMILLILQGCVIYKFHSGPVCECIRLGVSLRVVDESKRWRNFYICLHWAGLITLFGLFIQKFNLFIIPTYHFFNQSLEVALCTHIIHI